MQITRDQEFLSLIAENVKNFRLNTKLSQEELAWQCEIDRTYISKIERGIANPSILILFKISNILGIELQDLFSDPIIITQPKD